MQQNHKQAIHVIKTHLKNLEGMNIKEGEKTFAFDQSAQKQQIPTNNDQKNMQYINFQDMTLNKTHLNKYLEVTIILPPIQFQSIMSIIMDEKSNIMLMAVYNYKCQYDKTFLMGKKLIIRNPFYKIAADGNELLRIDDPSTITFINSNIDQYFQLMTTLIQQISPLDPQLGHTITNIIQKRIHVQKQSFVDDYIKKWRNILGKEKSQDMYWEGNHRQTPDLSQPDQMIDQNQISEISMMMNTNQQLFMNFQMANSLVINNPQSAFKEFQNILKRTQQYAVIFFNYGEIAFEIGYYKECEMAMRKYIEIHEAKKFILSPLYAFAHYHIGFCLDQFKQAKEAEKYLKKALSLDPQNIVFQQALSKFYFENGKIEDSQEICQKIVQNQPEKLPLDRLVEITRTYYTLFCIAMDKKELKQIVQYAEKLSQLDESNFQFVYSEITHLIVSDLYNLEEKLQLCDLLRESQEFDILSEELCLLAIISEVNDEVRIDAINTLPKALLSQEQQLEVGKDQEIQQIGDQSQVLLHLLKPQKEQSDLNVETIIQEYKQKKRKRITLEQSQQKHKDNQEKFTGFLAEVQYFDKSYIATVEPLIKMDKGLRSKFKQAAMKGFASHRQNASGIKFIKIKQDLMAYEIKIINQGDRLVCDKHDKIGKNRLLLNFNKLMSHKEVDRYIQQLK